MSIKETKHKVTIYSSQLQWIAEKVKDLHKRRKPETLMNDLEKEISLLSKWIKISTLFSNTINDYLRSIESKNPGVADREYPPEQQGSRFE